MRTVILGKGGHARVVAAALQSWGDPELCLIFVGEDEEVPQGLLVNGVGDPQKRFRLWQDLVWGHRWMPLVRHRSAVYHPAKEHGTGIQIMAGAIVQPGCKIGNNVLINTGAQVDHDCTLASHCWIAPGAVLCGEVVLEERCIIGAGAIILEGVHLKAGTFVPAGTVVVRQDDFRKPIPMVRRSGKDRVTLEKSDVTSIQLNAADYRVYSNPQPLSAPHGARPAERAGSDLSEP